MEGKVVPVLVPGLPQAGPNLPRNVTPNRPVRKPAEKGQKFSDEDTVSQFISYSL